MWLVAISYVYKHIVYVLPTLWLRCHSMLTPLEIINDLREASVLALSLCATSLTDACMSTW
jgi:hypothetical protein